MATTRKLIKHFENKTIPLTYVNPTNSLLLGSMECEEDAAERLNNAVDAMKEENIEKVAYHYVQSRRAESNTFNKVAFLSSVAIVDLFFLSYFFINLANGHSGDQFSREKSNNPFLNMFFLLYLIASLLPNISNTLRYRETKNGCDEWLKTKLSNNNTYSKIRQLPNKRDSLFTLTRILKEENINTTTLEKKGFGLS